jgi:hypothetical protein
MAQPSGGGRGGYDHGYGSGRTFHPEIRDRIDSGVRSGKLTRREAQRLYDELRDLDRLEVSYRSSGRGLDGRERRDLEVRTAQLRAEVWQEKHDWDRRGGRR